MDEADIFYRVGRCTYLRINLDAITHNVQFIRKRCSQNTGIIGVIKASAYGHGSRIIGRHLKSIGVERLAVATAGEGALLRNAGIHGPIHVFGNANPCEAEDLLKANLIPTVSTKAFIKTWSLFLRKKEQNGPLVNGEGGEDLGVNECKQNYNGIQPKGEDCCRGKIAIKVDTGLSRNGIRPEDLEDLILYCDRCGVDVDSIFTHFSKSPNDPEMTQTQLDRFIQVALPYRSRGINLHVANSGAILNGYGTDMDFVRPGISLYGLISKYGLKEGPTLRGLEHDTGDVGLKPALAWLAKPTLVKVLPPGKTIGYNNTYRTEKETFVATIAVGFGDGFSRYWSNKGFVRDQDGRHYPILGTVSMDAITIQVDSLDDADKTFYLMTDDFDARTSTFAGAMKLETITDTIVTHLSVRIPRVFTTSGKIQTIVKDIEDMY